ncbi:acyl-CoA dehydrogenase family protein, partial [Streptomyces sp. NPDC001939]
MIDGLTFSDNDQMARLTTNMRDYASTVRDDLRDATRGGYFPVEIYREMGAHGWLAPFAPASDGGVGGGVAEYCAIAEEVAFSGLVSPQIAIQGQRWLLDWGTAAQRDRYLGPISRGEIVFSESISEPGVGSSLKEMRATARRDGTDWILQGRKTHVNLGHQSDVTLMYAIAEEGLTAFLVDTSLPGFSSHETAPIGGRMLPTADMLFDDVRVPQSAVLVLIGTLKGTSIVSVIAVQ